MILERFQLNLDQYDSEISDDDDLLDFWIEAADDVVNANINHFTLIALN